MFNLDARMNHAVIAYMDSNVIALKTNILLKNMTEMP